MLAPQLIGYVILGKSLVLQDSVLSIDWRESYRLIPQALEPHCLPSNPGSNMS